ncbi:hypothetical protein GW17_00044289 [Ensete ventricosum]|nr:hypothetical protein GW17_00044289 [Ensete ventricosum]
MIKAIGELHCSSAYIRLREPGKLEDKADVIVLQRWDFRGVIDPLLLWRKSIGRKKGLRRWRIQRQTPSIKIGPKGRGKELHKTGVDGLLIKIAESEGLRVDAGVLD